MNWIPIEMEFPPIDSLDGKSEIVLLAYKDWGPNERPLLSYVVGYYDYEDNRWLDMDYWQYNDVIAWAKIEPPPLYDSDMECIR